MAFVFSQNKHFSEVSLDLQRQEPNMRSRLDVKLLYVMMYEELLSLLLVLEGLRSLGTQEW